MCGSILPESLSPKINIYAHFLSLCPQNLHRHRLCQPYFGPLEGLEVVVSGMYIISICAIH